jgi:hypothetical protein
LILLTLCLTRYLLPAGNWAIFVSNSAGFKNVYGISWSDASTILSKVLAAEYATFGAPPK